MRDGYSLADIGAVTGNNGNNGFGNGEYGAWWIIIFVLFFAFGGRWNGNNGNSDSGLATILPYLMSQNSGADRNYVLNSDFATLERQIDSGFDRLNQSTTNINNGICDGFYAMNTNFGTLNTNLCNQFGNVTNAITQNGYENRLATQNLGSQLASCCCETQTAIQGVNYNMAQNTNTLDKDLANINYNMATNTCSLNNNLTTGVNAIQNTMCSNTRDIVDVVNSTYRSLHDEIVANRLEDKNAQITAQQNEIYALRLAASQQHQSSDIKDYVNNEFTYYNPRPIPAFQVPIPYQYGNCSTCGNY